MYGKCVVRTGESVSLAQRHLIDTRLARYGGDCVDQIQIRQVTLSAFRKNSQFSESFERVDGEIESGNNRTARVILTCVGDVLIAAVAIFSIRFEAIIVHHKGLDARVVVVLSCGGCHEDVVL